MKVSKKFKVYIEARDLVEAMKKFREDFDCELRVVAAKRVWELTYC